ncbi:MAG: hypothetical protein ABIH46_00060 [Chloroflexota bacterium]
MLQKKSIPTVTIVTSEFVPLAKFLAKARGFPDLPLVVVPHPFETLAAETVRKVADEKFDELMKHLTGETQKVSSLS